jgi:hypothetical protein
VNPFKFITELSKINNQYIFIEVPCLDYNFCNIPFSIIGDEHVNLFSLESLSYLMKKAGYSVLDVDLYFNLCSDLIGGNPMISTLWEKSSKPNSVSKEKFIPISTQKLITDYLFEAKRKIRLLNSIIDDIDDNSKLAIWGTGFTTSLLLGNTNLAKKNIVKFYDNDLRRNNTEYYHRKINPFHVSDVNNNNVEIILVATYGYQNEIIQILENHDIYNYIKVF